MVVIYRLGREHGGCLFRRALGWTRRRRRQRADIQDHPGPLGVVAVVLDLVLVIVAALALALILRLHLIVGTVSGVVTLTFAFTLGCIMPASFPGRLRRRWRPRLPGFGMRAVQSRRGGGLRNRRHFIQGIIGRRCWHLLRVESGFRHRNGRRGRSRLGRSRSRISISISPARGRLPKAIIGRRRNRGRSCGGGGYRASRQ